MVRSSATGPNGSLTTRVVKGQDSAGNERDIVVADVPSDGTNYNYLVLKQAELKITVKLKEEFRKDQASKNYLALLQDSNGLVWSTKGISCGMVKMILQTQILTLRQQTSQVPSVVQTLFMSNLHCQLTSRRK